jgi:hypothetical protein
MGASPITRPSLLVRIRDTQDNQAWSQFVEIYAPLIAVNSGPIANLDKKQRPVSCL